LFEEVFTLVSSGEFSEEDERVRSFLLHVSHNGLSDDQVFDLSKAIARSSKSRLNLHGLPFTDVPSTGGLSGLSTLVAPLLIAISGGKVFKVSATGRPAGAIDTLQTLPGYRADLSLAEIKEFLPSASYIHILPTTDFAPADKKLIKMRRSSNAMSSPDLAIASLLAKKLCTLIPSFVLDVRVGESGNVGSDVPRATEFAKRFCRIARRCGMRARCVLTDLREWPQSPYLGRGESILGLADSLCGRLDNRTWDPLRILVSESITLADSSVSPDQAEENLTKAIAKDGIQRVAKLLERHGVQEGAFPKRIDEVRGFAEVPLRAKRTAWVHAVDLNGLKKIVMNLYTSVPHPPDGSPPWEIGLRWKLTSKEVQAGQEICSLRCRGTLLPFVEAQLGQLETEIWNCIMQGETVGERVAISNVVLGIVDEDGELRNTSVPLSSTWGTARKR
jgi:thymidine phosphorylase